MIILKYRNNCQLITSANVHYTKAAVVGKQTIAVYDAGGCSLLFKRVVANVGRGQPKSRLHWLPRVWHPAKYEHSRWSHRHTGNGKL